ncbi:crotonase/enoyl-CoA hydratase family protein [Ferrovibrio sp.]|uniref:crotonase/enoyl-CoA hydratase family protein n=1 Tax=Ferrovibrio sp. TaxID=1917215 RepID=UPI0025BA9E30|nr:crotonase/enoyl-CoA hydratase family protein [Ferrovibrio sp.]MBX3453761.1 crotonase/enoyl-CoA hydratase family protein [Ferrovibrio sp.]
MSQIDPDGEILTRLEDGVFVIGINRPAKYNGFTPKMLRELSAAYTAFEREDKARVGLLYAEGPHFTAGLDLPKVAPLMGKNNLLVGLGQIDPCNNQSPFRSKPLVAAVQGITYTLGIELMLAADMVVAASDCRFSQLEVKRGIMATGGATIRMVERAGWGNAMRYLLTGDEFDVATALRFGFVQEVTEPGGQYAEAMRLARSIAAQAPLALAATIRNARLAVEHGPMAAVEDFRATQQVLMQSQDVKEGVASFVERRPARFTGQ